MLTRQVAGNISGEATASPGNISREATRTPEFSKSAQNGAAGPGLDRPVFKIND
jgi:hypothetical protein